MCAQTRPRPRPRSLHDIPPASSARVGIAGWRWSREKGNRRTRTRKSAPPPRHQASPPEPPRIKAFNHQYDSFGMTGEGVDLSLTADELVFQLDARQWLESPIPREPLRHFDTEIRVRQ